MDWIYFLSVDWWAGFSLGTILGLCIGLVTGRYAYKNDAMRDHL